MDKTASSKKRKRSGKVKQKNLFDTDRFVRDVHTSLKNDLKPMNPSWFPNPRKCIAPVYENWPAYHFKVMAQLEHFGKRVVLADDIDFKVLELIAFNEFEQLQNEVGIKRYTRRLDKVIERAREIVAEILGPFSYDRFFRKCKFGKRAAKDLKRRGSFLDKRLETLNGTAEQIEWFKACMAEDIHLHRACRVGLKKAYKTYVLNMSGVPKSWKAARLVCPPSTIGGFLSTGLGVYLRERLEDATHIDLAKQQHHHQEIARKGSLDDSIATLDMKRASDSYCWEHVELLLPEDWHPVFEVVNTPLVCFKDKLETTIKKKSVMLMGDGHTFPAQTLFFYSICKAVAELLGSKSRVEVYGDDIIVAKRISSYVIDIFDDFGFTVNADKSFTHGPFRESCGGDYHTGLDVRPFMPELVCVKTDKYEFTEILHKFANGLLERWDYVEVSETYDMILNRVVAIWGNLCPIPENGVEYEGLKFIPSKFDALVKKPIYKDGLVHHLVLSRKIRKRSPKRQRIYYWYWLRGPSPVDLYGDNGDGILDQSGQEPRKEAFGFCWKSKTL